MADKPRNHVTEAQRAYMAPGTEWPEVSRELVEYLESVYPARCFVPDDRETLNEHILYSGAHNLVRDLRAIFEEQRRRAGDDGEEPGATSVEIE